MPTPAPAPDEAVLKEAAAWFARLNTRSISSATLEDFRTWRQEPGRRDAYAEIERAWRRTSALAGGADMAAAVDEALARGGRRPGWGRSPAVLVGVLLALVMSVGAGLLAWPGLAGRTYATGIGEQRLVQLADGSRVRLDTDTRLSVRLTGKARRIRLERGQAFFDVAHDATRPFVVDAGAADVRALGTRFDVRRDSGLVRVTLVQGSVEVRPAAAAARPVVLRPGEQVTADGGLSPPRRIDVTAATSWTDGRIIFHAVPLNAAVAEVNRYSRRRIVLDAPSVAGEAVTGAFDSGDVDAFVSAVSELHGLRARPEGEDVIRLTPAGT